MSSFVLKIIAIITMFIDHIGYAIFGKLSCFNYIGRIAFPIFAFQISEGYIHTKNLKKYFLRLFIFAIISQIPFILFNKLLSNNFSLNIFFTLLLGLISIYLYDKSKNKFVGIISATLMGILANLAHCDYGFYGVAIIFIFYIFKTDVIKSSIAFMLTTTIKYLIPIIKYGFYDVYLYLLICTLLPIIFISLYNGKKGKDTKYLLYLFYPIHLLLIYGINLLINIQ